MAQCRVSIGSKLKSSFLHHYQKGSLPHVQFLLLHLKLDISRNIVIESLSRLASATFLVIITILALLRFAIGCLSSSTTTASALLIFISAIFVVFLCLAFVALLLLTVRFGITILIASLSSITTWLAFRNLARCPSWLSYILALVLAVLVSINFELYFVTGIL